MELGKLLSSEDWTGLVTQTANTVCVPTETFIGYGNSGYQSGIPNSVKTTRQQLRATLHLHHSVAPPPVRCILSITVCSLIEAPTFLSKALQAACCIQHTLNCKHSHRISGLTVAPHRKQQPINITVTWDVPPCSLTGRGNLSQQHTATYIPDSKASQNRRKQFQY